MTREGVDWAAGARAKRSEAEIVDRADLPSLRLGRKGKTIEGFLKPASTPVYFDS